MIKAHRACSLSSRLQNPLALHIPVQRTERAQVSITFHPPWPLYAANSLHDLYLRFDGFQNP
ncbi:hypothetical protein Mapa_012324 [Marchantia paleacea]|nr:hypothetical protein Mapa_012324 [Marchantia paleacea]